ncbi:histidyl-tRNA synthetase [Aspergillus sclerotialis]|uniref:Histidine--tRNA ligase, mitochondrial n=1 Tax=Aspergillus sclerotialis TaxID=2070753 RepID=A0A3A3A0J3_9EURO|nr:histidyl-tRNA synthetase [Aspergillus sclerotialis]
MKINPLSLLRPAGRTIASPIVVVFGGLPSTAAAVRPKSTTPTTNPHRRHFSSNLPLSYSTPKMPKDKTASFNLKTPKGTKDWSGSDALLRDRIFSTIADIFKRHGGTALDTPVFELRDILAGKYGEDSKLIYDLQDQGGELCSLRYDLTVPFARWLAMNPDVRSMKRYHIAKVYRRDQPAVSKGRMREFYQCDFDIAGTFDPMVPDAEILRIVSEVFEGLGWQGRYCIKINHRKILDGLFEVCGVPSEKIRPISSAVDKLDKMPWADVRKEMVEEKGLDGDVADRIEKYVMLKGGRDLLDTLLKDETLMGNESAKAGLEDMRSLMDYLEAFGVLERTSFDLSLARGLDYYTGVIYEVITEGSAPAAEVSTSETQNLQKAGKKDKSKNLEDDDRSNDPTLGVGSVAAGGRYDNLVGMFLPKAQIPCVGVSFGVDRIFSITKARIEREQKGEALRNSEVDAFVMAFGGKGFNGMLKERMEVCKSLWSAGIKAEFAYKLKPKLPQQFKAAEQGGIPFGIILGEDEMAAGKVKIKEMGLPDGHPEKEGVLVDFASLVDELKPRIAKKNKEINGAGVSEVAQQMESVKV